MAERDERYYADIKELTEVSNADNATVLLRAGWELISIKERYTKSADGETKEPIYILGRKASPLSSPLTPSSAPAEAKATEAKAVPPQPQPQPTKFFSCKYCGRPIKWSRNGERWQPTNPDGSNHICEREKEGKGP